MKKQILLFCFLFFAAIGFAENVNITGVVTSSEDNEPLIGASVQVKGNATLGVATDFDGRYTISVPAGSTLQYSFVGCTTQEKKVSQSGTVNVVLASDSHMLNEVVAIGYGVMKKSDLTGSVATVSSDKLTKTPASNLANALQGQAAGVTINNNSGQPGAAPEVRIRGVGTVNGASPIYVVDGIIVDDISFLSPNDIESTEILKDASATAIYGSRGANGVIIVTTRSGAKDEKTRVTLDAYVGVQKRWRKLDVMNAKDFADTRIAINGTGSEKKYYAANGFNKWLSAFCLGTSKYYPTVYDAEKNPTGFDYSAVDTDWQDEVFRNALIQNYHLSIDGGSKKTTYSPSRPLPPSRQRHVRLRF